MRRITDPQVLKGLAQPIRQKLYRLLVQLGPATGATLSKRLGTDPGQTSYHLRELARHGFVEDVPELARDRRERWWRAVPGSTGWAHVDFPTPEGQAVAAAAKAQVVIDEFERVRAYERSRDTWSPAWQAAATSSDSFLRLTSDELAGLTAELHEVLVRYARLGRERAAAPEPDPDREHVFLFFHAFPERP
ncbi:winged helix-turn-helix domain-containing protein [Catellatospora tritici]|uniref:winged helix-turn-helix domain-containing protein n=1 Tax=Catellatospora tritici TaxID=2851566 RepID=UPI001C2DB6DD|nr:helix-turn-helix domain-containing protein [Catellatospora tritici]MBV1854914.1 helix-turn-helix domain-containing protein [Catellatospora tritici]